MPRNLVSLFLTLIFVAYLTAPTIIKLIDKSVDISVIYAGSEEGEKGGEKVKDVEVLFYEFNHNLEGLENFSNVNSSNYYFKNYPKPHLNLISPPPEISIL